MRNAWCSLDSPAAQSGAMASRVGRAFLPSPKSRWAGGSLPGASNNSSTIPFVQSMTSLTSSRDDIRPAHSSSKRDSSPSSSGQGQTWALAPGPQWREELSDRCQDSEASSSFSPQPELLQPRQERPSRERREWRGAARRGTSEGLSWDRRQSHPKSKKLRRAEGTQADRGYSSSSDGNSSRQVRRGDPELRSDWRDDDEFKAAVQLNRTIAATSSAEDVLCLVEEHGHVFNSVNAATAFHRLAKFGQEASAMQQELLRSDARTKKLAELVEVKWEDWGGRAANNIAWAHAVLGHGSPTTMSKVEAKLLAKLSTMSTHEMCIILWSFAKTGYNSPQSFRRAVPWLLSRKHELTIQTITMLTWAYATAAPYDRDLFATCCEAALNNWQSFDLRALSNMTWACARVEHYNEKLFDAVAARVAVGWEQVYDWDLGNFAWGLGKAYGELGVQGSALADEDRERAITRYLSDNPDRKRALEAISAAALQRVGDLNMRTISNIAYGCACVHFWDGCLMDALAQRAIDLACQGNGQSLAILLWAFSTLRHEHPALTEALAHRGLQLLHTPAEEGGLNNTAMTMVFWAYANLGNNTETSQKLLLQLAEEACERRETYTSLPAVAWSLTVAGCLPDALLRKIRNSVGDLRDLDDLNLSQLYQTELAMRLRDAGPPHSPMQVQASARAEDLFRECYQMGEVRQKSGKFWELQLAHGKRYITAIHLEVARVVQSLKGKIVLEHDTGEWSVDIGFPEQCVAIEVDGPSHFANNTLRPLGPTLLKRRLLAARGWEVVSVPYFHWSELHSDYERQVYIYLALQAKPRGKHLVEAPTTPARLGEAQALSVHKRVQDMLQRESLRAQLSGQAWASPDSSHAHQQPSSSHSSSANPVLSAVDASKAGLSLPAADMAACSAVSAMSEELERPSSGVGTSSDEDASSADSQREGGLEGRGARLAVLQYKRGRLSRHDLLAKVASSRAAAAANEDGSAASAADGATSAALENGAEEQ